MIRRLFIVAVSLAALTACTTYNSGYRNYQPAQAGYGDYYYAPDPGPSYYAPGYVHYPAYYSLYWGLDRHYYSAWRQPHFHYGVTWFPNDWFGFSAVHRYPRYSYWHPYAPYRYSAWDHRFAWHHYAPSPRYRYRSTPRYGHPSNERHMRRDQLVDRGDRREAPYAGGPRARGALEAAGPQGVRNAPQRTAYGPQSAAPTARRAAEPVSAPEARMRQQALQARESRIREDEARMRNAGSPAQARQAIPRESTQRPWQQTQAQPAGRARTVVQQDVAPSRGIPDRRESQGPRQFMGDPRGARTRQVTDGRMQDPRMGEAPRARPVAPNPVQQQPRMRQSAPVRQDPRQDMRQAPRDSMPRPVGQGRNAMPPPNAAAAPQPRMQRAAPQPSAPAVRQAAPPARQSAPSPRPAPTPQSGGRARITVDREE